MLVERLLEGGGVLEGRWEPGAVAGLPTVVYDLGESPGTQQAEVPLPLGA